MKGIQFVVDENGEKRAVQLDLAEWGELWEDIYDQILARDRASESRVSWDEIRDKLDEPGNE